MSDFKVEGVDALLRKLSQLGEAPTSEPVKRKMREVTGDLKVATVALSRVDTHTMEKSVYDRVSERGDALVGEVGVTAQAEDGYPYPIRQHEDLTLDNGPKSELKPAYDGMEVGAKFLERPLEKYRDKYIDELAKGLDKRIKELGER